MTKRLKNTTLIGLLCVAGASAKEPILFNRDVRPILANHCLHCHGPDGEQRQANLRLDSPNDLYDDRGGYQILHRNDPQKGELLARITSDDPDSRMPPTDSPSQPTDAEIKTLERWIRQGAPWAEHWSFVPPKRPPTPTTSDATWPKNPIDAFVLARIDAENLAASPEADRHTLIRRATLALTGLPPTLKEVDDFLEDSASDAYDRVIDRLLKSAGYGEHMAFAWLDAARYADTSGYQADWERFMWPWRDWVVKAFNDNMLYDQFTIEQLAGDLLTNPSISQRLASGFNRNHRINDEGGSLDAEFEVEYVVDRVDTTATIWLGLTAGCARCHDHKYDPISQREFYQLVAFFNNVPEKGIDGRVGYARPHLDIPNREVQLQLTNLRDELSRLQQESPEPAGDAGVSRAADENIPVAELAETSENQRKASKVLATSATADKNSSAAPLRIKKLQQDIEKLDKIATTPVMVMQELPARKPTYLLKRGAYDQPDTSEVLEPALPGVFGISRDDAPLDRLGLARWLMSTNNPLVARVTVNRVWQQHFGVGLVKSSEDFGTRGDSPSHPDLLDWLATEFIRLGWDMKAVHRLILTSATFRQSSKTNSSLQQLDPDNRLLARGPRLRLSGASIRDQALSISGLLCSSMGGPSVKPYQPSGLWKELSFGTGKTTVDFYVQDSGSRLYRRGLYTFWKRTVAPPRMAVFDGSGREMCRVRTGRTNTPLQALTLQNDVTFVESARHMAERMIKKNRGDSDAALSYAWRLAVARVPSDDELDVLRIAFDRYLKDFTDAPGHASELLSFGESPRDEALDPATHAAYTMIALSILNLDETITRE